MRPLTIVLLLVGAYLLFRWHRRRQAAAALAAVAAGAPVVPSVTVYAPNAMTAPVVPGSSITVTTPHTGVVAEAAASPNFYWSVPDSFIALRG